MYGELQSVENKQSLEWLAFMAQLPAEPHSFAGVSVAQQLLTGRWIVFGAVVYNTATTAGSIAIYDGMDATGQLITVASTPASVSTDLQISGNGVVTTMGVFLHPTTGTFTGTVWALPLWRYKRTPPAE